MNQEEILNVFNQLQILVENPDIFIEKNRDQNIHLKNSTKTLYDHIKKSKLLLNKNKSLPKLLLDNFDEEQIWGQIDLHNVSAISHFNDKISKIDKSWLTVDHGKHKASVDILEKNEHSDSESSLDDNELNDTDDDDDSSEKLERDPEENENEVSSKPKGELSVNSEDEEDSDIHEDTIFIHDSDQDSYLTANDENERDTNIFSNKKSDEQSTDDNSDDELSEKIPKKSSKSKELQYKSELDDKFFKESKLRHFLKVEDLKEEKQILKERDSHDSEEEDEDIDMFKDEADEPCDMMYKDFFDDPDFENDNNEHGESDVSMDDKDNEFLDGQDSYDEENIADEGMEEETKDINEDDNLIDKNQNKTPFQLQQEKFQKQISEYEGTMLQPQAWHLTGEVDACTRPKDGLLNLDTDFEINAKPVIIEDKDLCKKLENMIMMTIKNKAYSDGVKQYKTNDEIIAYKKEVVLEQTKSKKSLAQEYEDIYLKKQMVQEDEEENPKHVEIKKFMDSLFPDLHALFSHIPKPALPDIKIVTNVPAVTVEEVAPTSVSDLTLLAPEEVKKRTGLVKGVSERTTVDRKRERRKKKVHQRLAAKKREAKGDAQPSSSRAKKQEKLDLVRKLKQQRNTKIATGGEKIKSSKQFFERLQEKVDTKKVHHKKKM